jgi:proton glutamate symport protein
MLAVYRVAASGGQGISGGTGILREMTRVLKSENGIVLAAVVLLVLGFGLQAAQHGAPMLIAELMRWLAVALLCVFAVMRRSLSPWIVVAMVAGVEIGIDAPRFAVELRVLSDIFLRLIKTIVAPLILATLITGIAGHGDMKSVGRMAWKSLVYFEVITTLALVIGLVAIHVTQAGVGLAVPVAAGVAAMPAAPAQHWQDFVLHVFPENLVKSIYEGQILQVSVFAVFFGIALALLPVEKREPVLRLTESISEVMFKFTNIVMYFAPVAVGAALAYTVGQMGAGVLVNLGKLVLTYYGALIALAVLVLWPVMVAFRLPVVGFLKAVAEPASIAFATSASEAALPRAMEAMEAYGVPRKVVAFVIPAGYSFNMDGAAVYLTLASMFVAQAAGLHLSLGEQVGMVLMLMLASKGVSGVPRATLMVLMAAAASLRLPPEPIFVILGIDAVMDMGRTTANVVGNCLASAVVARWEGVYGSELPSAVVVEGMAE